MKNFKKIFLILLPLLLIVPAKSYSSVKNLISLGVAGAACYNYDNLKKYAQIYFLQMRDKTQKSLEQTADFIDANEKDARKAIVSKVNQHLKKDNSVRFWQIWQKTHELNKELKEGAKQAATELREAAQDLDKVNSSYINNLLDFNYSKRILGIITFFITKKILNIII